MGGFDFRDKKKLSSTKTVWHYKRLSGDRGIVIQSWAEGSSKASRFSLDREEATELCAYILDLYTTIKEGPDDTK